MTGDNDDALSEPSANCSNDSATTPLLSDNSKIEIPASESTSFSFKKLWTFTGPGFLMSIAFLDPGNISSDLQTGTLVQYKLLWVLLWATIAGLIMQRLSARLGVVTRSSLAEMCFIHYKTIPRYLLWIMTEIAIIGSDMQEVIGTAISIYFLSNNVIPLWGGVLITILDTLLFLYFDQYGLRKLEFIFAIMISVMAVTFGYEYFASQPNFLEVLKGMFIPRCQNCASSATLQAIGIIGSIVMPHNLYLHSALVKSRDVNLKKIAEVKEANFYFFIEATVAVIVSFFINLFVVTVFGNELYNRTNHDVREQCRNFLNGTTFPNNHERVRPDLYTAGQFLGCTFGASAMYIWAVGILASGQSGTMTITYAGQFVMEGFLNLQWVAWKRALFCRTISVIPTFVFAFYSDTNHLTDINIILNAVMSLQLPFAVIPTIAFTSEDACKKWKSLQDRYARELKKLSDLKSTGTESQQLEVQTWDLFENLSFLRNHIGYNKRTVTNYTPNMVSACTNI
ncbi:hypothetical protein FQA39_LY16775 [Lamprigera yunnana]|nr:hypothetical protein FQA39_LY16775 [Lamprigera yunnana]